MDEPVNKETKKKRGKEAYKFYDGWLEMKEFQDWLKKSDDESSAICTLCKCTVIAHKSSILKHGNSEKHKKNETKMGISRIPEDAAANQNKVTADYTFELITSDVKRAEKNLYSFIAEHNLTVQAADCLVPLCKNIFPDSDIARKIASKRLKNVRRGVVSNLDVLYMKMRVPGMFFSLKMDVSKTLECTLTVAYMDGENGVRYSFFDKFTVKLSSIKFVYSTVVNSILSRGIPLENLVGFTSDTNDVVGETNSVFSYLKVDCPNIVRIKPSSQMIHLAASKACSKLPKHLEDLLKNLGAHFSNTYGKKQGKFKDFQEFFFVDIHKLLSPSKTMYLSVKECVERILKQYVHLQIYLSHTKDSLNTFQTILNTMKNPFTVAYLEFLCYILGVLADFSTIFQAEKPLLHKMKPEVEKLLKNICFNFLRTDYVRKTPAFEIKYTVSSYLLPLNEVYLGVSATETINDLKKMPDIEEIDVATFYANILNFYTELITVIREEFDFQNELYDIVSIVDPQIAQDLNIKSLAFVWKRFPMLKKFINVQALDNEWKKHGLLDHHLKRLDPRIPADEYWQKVFQLKNSLGVPAFPNLYTTMKLLLVLPFFPGQVRKEPLAGL